MTDSLSQSHPILWRIVDNINMDHSFETILKKYKNVLAIRNKIRIKACYLKGKRFLSTFWHKYGVNGI